MARNRLTLLEIVQRVADKLGEDKVNSISDSPVAADIAAEAQTTYYDLLDREDWPHLNKITQLESVSNTDRPNYLRIPEDVVKIYNVRYDRTLSSETNLNIDRIEYKDPDDFLDYTYTRNSSDSNVQVVQDSSGVKMFIANNKAPRYWTTFDDEHLVFDSFDSSVDTTLQQSKSSVEAKIIPEWVTSDTFIPDLPDHMFSLLLSEVTASMFIYRKQAPSPKDEQRARRGISRLRIKASKVNEQDRKADYGRRRYRHYGSFDGTTGSIFHANNH